MTVPLAAAMETGNDPEVAAPAPAGPVVVLLQDATSKPSPAQTTSSVRCERLVMWSSSIGLRRTKCARCDTR